MKTLLTCLWFIAIVALSYAQDDAYCSLCQYHTMCKTSDKGVKCPSDYKSLPFSDAEIAKVLEVHNAERNKVALGLETQTPEGAMPQAANMLKMEWDTELAEIALRLAQQCVYDHECDACLMTRQRGFWVGQNLAEASGSLDTPAHVEWLVNYWISEVKLLPLSYVEKYNVVEPGQTKPDVGHFTQVVWWNSRLVGCGASNYGGKQLFVCNYGSAANLPKDAMYLPGTAASKCPKGTSKDSTYPGLCALDAQPADGKFHTDDVFLNFPTSSRPAPDCEPKSFRA